MDINSKINLKLLVASDTLPGGEWIATKRLLQAINKSSKSEFKITVVTSDVKGIGTKDLEAEKIVLVKKHMVNKPFSFLKKIISDLNNVTAALKKLSKSHSFDIYITTSYLYTIPLFLSNKINRNKIYLYFHGEHTVSIFSKDGFNYQNIIRRCLETFSLLFSKKIIVPSYEAKDYLSHRLKFIIHFKKIILLPNIVPDAFFQKPKQTDVINFREKYNLSTNKHFVTYSGRITFYKGLENLVRAIEKFHKKYNDYFLIIAYPSGSVEPQVLTNIQRFLTISKSETNVIFISDLNLLQLVTLYTISDLVILPSEIEMAPLAISEALACGCCVMGTKTGNLPKIITQLNSKLLLEDNAIDTIYKGLSYYSTLTSKKRTEISKVAKRISRAYQKKNVLKKFTQIFQSTNV